MNQLTTLALAPVKIHQADPVSKSIMESAQKSMGMVPNLYEAMANNPALLESYVTSSTAFRTNSGFTPQEQEVLFLSISVENNCTYCVAAHSFLGDHVSHVPREVTEAIRNEADIPHEKYQALRTFAKAVVSKRGHASDEDVDAFLAAGYEVKHMLGVVTAVGIKTLSNYFNHLFHTPADEAFKGRLWSKVG